jgi:hypothetical protein
MGPSPYLRHRRRQLVCFGHGRPLRNPAKLQRFVEKLEP